MGAGFPLFARAMFDTLGLDWGSALLGFLSIAFIPIPFALWYYGRRVSKLRSHSQRSDSLTTTRNGLQIRASRHMTRPAGVVVSIDLLLDLLF